MEVVVVSNPKKDDREIPSVVKMFKDGLKTFHLRKSNYSRKGFEAFINEIPHKYHNKIVIHDYYSLAKKYDLKGIHVTRKFRKKKFKTWVKIKYLKMYNNKLTVSKSFHSISKLQNAEYGYDYVFLSPTFDSISKSNHTSQFSPRLIKRILEDTKMTVYALGGVDASKIELAKELGFKGIGLLGSIWNSDKDPFEAYKDVLDTIDFGDKRSRIEINPIQIQI